MGPKKADPSPALAAIAAAPSKPPKGHKQKGAGTVIVGRAPIETEDGIVLKAHERLPSVLLNEYCQREKRPKPKYESAGRGRMTVTLPDKKNSKDDLKFTPVQSFDSDKLARDFAALLGLFHFQKAIPLERTLPEPFSSTWLGMISTSKEEDAAAKVGGGAKGKKADSGKQQAAPIAPALLTAAKCVANVIDKMTSDPVATTASAQSKSYKDVQEKKSCNSSASTTMKVSTDWLCDQCGSLNYATLASGLPRVKCFKCQTPKSALSTALSLPVGGKSGDVDGPLKLKKPAPSAGIHH
jgi:hypothetical protein